MRTRHQAGFFMSLALLEQKRQRIIKAYTEAYPDVVADVLGNVRDLATLLVVFNHNFVQYQSKSAWKLDPNSMRDGYITCDGAALLVALWHQLFFQVEKSIFAVQRCIRREYTPHVALGITPLPTTELATSAIDDSYQYTRATKLKDQEPTEVTWLHWTMSNGLDYLAKSEVDNLTSPANMNYAVTDWKSFAAKAILSHRLPKGGKFYPRSGHQQSET